MENQQIGTLTRNDRICMALIVAKFHQGGFFIKCFDNGADLSARQTFLGPIGNQCDHVQHGQ